MNYRPSIAQLIRDPFLIILDMPHNYMRSDNFEFS